jgi:ABC-2 type transport system ATP-binding protein
MDLALEITDLLVTFRKGKSVVTALNHVDLSLPKGHILGFIGPNGAGKTTAMHAMLGFIKPDSGSIKLMGTDINESISRSKIGYLQENPDTYGFLTGRELLLSTARLFSLSRQEGKARAERLLSEMNLQDASDRRISTYSRGMTQRICLAQALINDPDLIILDEPTGGLDPFGRMHIRTIIASLKDQGKTVLFSSHELSEVELVCDYIAIISRGKIVAQGRTANVISGDESLERFFMRVVEK